MIDYKELRIGNFISTIGEKEPIVVTAKLLAAFESTPQYCKLYSGTELTEELLLDLGFKKIKISEFGIQVALTDYDIFVHPQNDDYFIEINENDEFLVSIKTIDSSIISCQGLKAIKHLHKLQNFWYENTGIELTLIHPLYATS